MFRTSGIVNILDGTTKGPRVNTFMGFGENCETGTVVIKLGSDNVIISYEELRNQAEPAFSFNKVTEELRIKGYSTAMAFNWEDFNSDIEIVISNAKELYELLLSKGHVFNITHACPCD